MVLYVKEIAFSTSSVQHVKYVPLVHVNRYQCLKFGSLHLLQILGGLTDEDVKHIQEPVVGLSHNLYGHTLKFYKKFIVQSSSLLISVDRHSI